ncbi:MAG: pantetheine-phosphate adenylyltransferase [Aquificota bacterium]|uniref:Phosphopantetheine adenylyltransferase n=1 Tax=Hydrogenobacter sp. TaxID=2152829 RepID=A0A7C2ZKR1_9AQUI|nr:pantetheine-phosphate adenylyltransferase [Aquificaceae bacterium]QWK13713.1 MAG: pantetheine-phosphate adenylyltransferase [Aquificota bacterium]HAV39980.1 pantetheine-phosphate adenylyltransferase [Aquificaceae bacterium]HCO39039.1 pantetheine-phosphate adenylyltransferase [Aquificaceae bacterium]
MKRAVYPGTFDPPHLGHLDIVNRALKLFDHVIVAIAKNPRKSLLFDAEERVDMFSQMVKDLKKVEVKSFDGLLVDFMKKERVEIVVRGVRLFTDFEYELQIALNNYKLAKVETVFLMPSQDHIHISSTIVRDIASYCGCLKGLVHPYVEKKLKEKFGCK